MTELRLGSSGAGAGTSYGFAGAGTSSGFVWTGFDDPTAFSMDDLVGGDDMHGFEELRPSQMPGAPVYPSQDVPS